MTGLFVADNCRKPTIYQSCEFSVTVKQSKSNSSPPVPPDKLPFCHFCYQGVN